MSILFIEDEFTQLDASLARRHQGAGLGLALTKKLVELHGGTIRARSPGEGKGSTFTIVFPLDGPDTSPAQSQPHTSEVEPVFIQPSDAFGAMMSDE